MLIFFGWIIFTIFVGVLGEKRKIGFGWAFVISLIFSPLVGLIVTLTSKRLEDIERESKQVQLQQEQNEALKKMADKSSVDSVSEELEKLKNLLDNGDVSEDEYQKMRAKLFD